MDQTSDHSNVFGGGVRLATIAAIAAYTAVFFGTATIFQIEDDNPLTDAAFDATPLLGASLLAAHLAALGALVVLVAGAGRSCASMLRENRGLRGRAAALVFAALIAAVVAFGLVVLYARLGGSIIAGLAGWPRMLSLFVAVAAFVAGVLAIGRKIVRGVYAAQQQDRKSDSVLDFGVGAVLAMLANVAAAIIHTVTLRSGSPELFADSIDHATITGYKLASGFYFSELVVANVVAGAFTIVAAVVVARAVVKLRTD